MSFGEYSSGFNPTFVFISSKINIRIIVNIHPRKNTRIYDELYSNIIEDKKDNNALAVPSINKEAEVIFNLIEESEKIGRAHV